MENMKIKIELTVTECNLIMAALGARPFAEVVDLIGSIKEQGERAIIAANTPEVVPGDTVVE